MPKTREEKRAYQREYYRKNKKYKRNPAQERARQRTSNASLRLKTIKFMGKKCVRCGYNDHRALQFDHINRLPAGERRRTGRQLYNDVLAHPEKFQLLCANCNWIKRWENKEYTRRFDKEPSKKLEEYYENE